MKQWPSQLYQLAIGLDQVAHGFVGLLLVPFGHPVAMADETLSASAWRLHTKSKGWNILRVVIDTLFFWQDQHCYNSYLKEKERKQLPREYQNG